jgi:hypothetical protein
MVVVGVELGDNDGGLMTLVFNTLPSASSTILMSMFADFEEMDGD